MLFPTLKTKRLVLDKITDADTDSIFALFSDKRVIEFYDLTAFTKHNEASALIELFHKRFRNSVGIRWAIRLTGSNVMIGTCGFNTWDRKMKNATIGYDLLPDYWNNGFTSEAVARIAAAGFSAELPCGQLKRIQADTVVGNLASEAVLTKAGFEQEGLRRQSGYWKNQFHDLKCFALINSDYN